MGAQQQWRLILTDPVLLQEHQQGTAAIGWVVLAAAVGSTTVRVELTPIVAGTPTAVEAPPEHSARHR